MPDACLECGNTRDLRRFCPQCGAEQPKSRPAGDDPMIGRLVADRYEITELLAAGGMGKVYRALQRSLDRTVAIKVIQPHLLSSSAVVSRFLREARALSRLNHPNVVSIIDFGRAARPAGEFLFLVMELLAGPDLATLLRSGERVAFPRVASIMRQTLAALAEAHHVGLVHRDVKPENIVLEPRRGRGDLVKVIDFGIAHRKEHTTDKGVMVGTASHMAPELANDEPSGPSSDLYAAGIVLFQLLTGRLPFDDPNPTVVLTQHAAAPRPDPRAVAPDREIPAALAEACLRAIAIDPAERYPTAEALATAIVRAVSSTRWTLVDSSLLPDPPSSNEGAAATTPTRMPAYRAPAESLYEMEESPLVGRAPLLAWVSEGLADRHMTAIALHGPTGAGKSRMLREAALLAIRHGAFVIEALVDPVPLSEIGFGGLREIVARLAGAQASEPDAIIAQASDPTAAASLRTIWTEEAVGPGGGGLRASALAALRWAVHRARERADGAPVVLVIDDVDRMDASSSLVLDELVGGERLKHFLLLTTSEEPRAGWPADRVRSAKIEGLSPEDAARLLRQPGGALGRAGPVEPLYIEQLRKLRSHDPDADAPRDLESLVERHLDLLPPLERRVVEAIAVTGGGSLDDLAAVLERPEELGVALRPLSDAGLIEVHQGSVRLTHAIFGRVALAIAPVETTAALHGRVAAALAESGAGVEVRAHHAVRGPPGLGAFALLDEAARVRAVRGDHEGVVAACWEGIHAAEALAAAGDAGAALDSRIAFKQRLAEALVELRRFHEANAALLRALEATDPQDARRVRVLERLAAVATHLRRPGEAERWRREARELATAAGRD